MALSASLATAEALVQLQQQLAEAYSDLERCRARPAALRPLGPLNRFAGSSHKRRAGGASASLHISTAGSGLVSEGSRRRELRARCVRLLRGAACVVDEVQHAKAVAARARAAGDPARSRSQAGRGAARGVAH